MADLPLRFTLLEGAVELGPDRVRESVEDVHHALAKSPEVLDLYRVDLHTGAEDETFERRLLGGQLLEGLVAEGQPAAVVEQGRDPLQYEPVSCDVNQLLSRAIARCRFLTGDSESVLDGLTAGSIDPGPVTPTGSG